MDYQAFAITNTGNERQNNQDTYYLNGYFPIGNKSFDEEQYKTSSGALSVYAVFDGMGGISCGEEASYVSAKALDDYLHLRESQDVSFDGILSIKRMNRAVCRRSEELSVKSGSTVVMATIENNNLKIFNVGDSRAYLFRQGKLHQLSEDHNEAGFYKKMKVDVIPINAENVLTQHLGIREKDFLLEPFCSNEIQLNPDDIILLCSDGLTNMVNDEEIESILSVDEQPQKKSEQLVDAALKNGGKDNVTVIVVFAF